MVKNSFTRSDGSVSEWMENEFDPGRNYTLFGILAGVRGGGFDRIDDPRGVPEGACTTSGFGGETPGYKDSELFVDDADTDDDNWDRDPSDGHSASWQTLAELKAYDWNREGHRSGVVSPRQFEVWRKEGKPWAWSGGVSGPNHMHVSNQEMAHLIETGVIDPSQPGKRGFDDVFEVLSKDGKSYSTRVEWTERACDVCPGFLLIMERMEDAARCLVHDDCVANIGIGKACYMPSDDDIRYVYFFDS
jgi:hypothetical protein